MLTKPAMRPVSAHIVRKFNDYLEDERGSVAIFMVIAFVLILMLGGIAVDVMRFETRRVALQETLDRAVLSAANLVLPKTVTPQSVVTEWFQKAGLGNELTHDYFPPTVGGSATDSSREAIARATVRSYNHFMQLLDYPYFEGPAVSVAQQGVSKIEVMMVLDITGSMTDPSGATKKIDALHDAADKFVEVLKFSKDASGKYTVNRDPLKMISIGMVPYAANVNIPNELLNQFTVSHKSSWDGVANMGVQVSFVNCLEIPPSTYDKTALATDVTYPMAAVTNAYPSNPNVSGSTAQGTSTGGVMTIAPSTGVPTPTVDLNSNDPACFHGDNPATSAKEYDANKVVMPSTDPTNIRAKIKGLIPRGRTSIAIGMRWGTALLDQAARPIYTNLLAGEAAMAGRPADNNAPDTRKIIVLMTDGEHVQSYNVKDEYKTGLSPIYRRTADRRFAIKFESGGPALTGGLRPGLTAGTNTCSGWVIPSDRKFFIPHLKASKVRQKNKSTEAEGAGTGPEIEGACDPLAWQSNPNFGNSSGVAVQLDWSEVWRYISVDRVVEQLYMRSGVGGTNDYNTVFNMFSHSFMGNDSNMDNLLDTNCRKAKEAGFEVFGIVLGNEGTVDETPVKNCSSPGTGYYHRVTDAANLVSTFEKIAVLISDLKLTQ